MTSQANSALRSLARLTAVFLVGWAVCFWPARLTRPDNGVLWMSVAAVSCLVPGWIAVLLDQFAAFRSDVKLMLGQMTVRFLAVMVTGVAVRWSQPQFGFADFYCWLVLFYLLAMVFEVVLLREKFAVLSQPPAADAQEADSSSGKL